MRAVVYHAPKDIRVESVPVPTCGDDEIRVKVDACAVCGTDLKSRLHGNPKIAPYTVIGHEFSGLVDTVGANVEGFDIGDRITMATSISCGECPYCERGWTNLCLDMGAMGFKYPGGMAEYTTIPERALRNGHVIKVPAGVAPEHAALGEPVSCAVNSMENCNLQQGDVVVVIGAGPMGILNAVVAKGSGASRIILAEINEARLKQAEGFGFHLLVNPAEEDLTEVVKRETGGLGADIVVVAAPAAKPQEEAIGMVRKRGTVCLFASLPVGKNMLSIDSRPLHYNELRVVGTSDSTPTHVAKAVELIATSAVPADKIATHILALEDIEKAYELMQSGESLRVVLKP
jgi:L-iditol 2-dehydrogenase